MATISEIQSEARSLCDANSVSYTAADLLRRCNQAYEDVVGFIIGCDGRWQWDDTNYTDFPIATTTMVNSQQDYTFNSAHLEVEGISVLDASGIWQKLTPIDAISEVGQDPVEFLKTDGLPIYYDKQGSSVLLYPAPATGSVTLASGLKIFFKRTADLYTSAQVTTGTKQPGFVSTCHMILAYKAALPYCALYKTGIVPFLQAEILRFEQKLKEHYGRRELDRRKKMSMSPISHR